MGAPLFLFALFLSNIVFGVNSDIKNIKIDAELPAGNIIVDSIEDDVVKIQQDLRDSKQWFYWAFRVRGAQGRTITFDFTNSIACF